MVDKVSDKNNKYNCDGKVYVVRGDLRDWGVHMVNSVNKRTKFVECYIQAINQTKFHVWINWNYFFSLLHS